MTRNPSAILADLRAAAVSEPAAVAFLEAQRWGSELADAACPHCGSGEVYMMKGLDGQRNVDYRWRCRNCKTMFTVRTGTVFAETRLPLRVWITAFWRACASKKGISALQLAREMEITHKSALFVLHRIRHGMGAGNDPKLTGTVEIDETYVGGKPRYKGKSKPGRGTSKIPVLAMVQRDGDVRFRMMERLTADRLIEVIAQNADLSCRVITDELPLYRGVASPFRGGHHTVKHRDREYVRQGSDVHSNTIESVFSLAAANGGRRERSHLWPGWQPLEAGA